MWLSRQVDSVLMASRRPPMEKNFRSILNFRQLVSVTLHLSANVVSIYKF